MTIRKLALTTALASATAFGAYAQGDASREGVADEQATPDEVVPAVPDADVPEATMDVDGMMTAPSGIDLDPVEGTAAERSSVEEILAEVEDGAEVSSVDDMLIGSATSHEGDGGADHRVYVDVAEDANIAAERIAFEVGSLNVATAGGGLEYDYTLEQLREAVAERVAAEAEETTSD